MNITNIFSLMAMYMSSTLIISFSLCRTPDSFSQLYNLYNKAFSLLPQWIVLQKGLAAFWIVIG